MFDWQRLLERVLERILRISRFSRCLVMSA